MIDRPTRPSQTDAAAPVLARTLVLVGLMGAGKTSVGKRLAGHLGVRFVDSDSEIETAAGMSIPEIFATLGEPAFRDGERRVIGRLLAEAPCVLATGGGAFIEPRTRAEITEQATSVWIRAGLDLLWDRVRDRPGRPLLDAPDPRAVLLLRMFVHCHDSIVLCQHPQDIANDFNFFPVRVTHRWEEIKITGIIAAHKVQGMEQQ
jgi:shikimate kinase